MLKLYLILLLPIYSLIYAQTLEEAEKSFPQIYDEIWNTPSENSRGSMPLGNGDIGINLWAESDGCIYLYISKTDSWDDYSSLLKVGKVKIKISPNPFEKYTTFTQRLDLNNGQIIIEAKIGRNKFIATIWIDANNPVINIDMDGNKEYMVEASAIIWRNKIREISENERHQAYGYTGSEKPIFSNPDSVYSDGSNEIIWFHHNKTSIWRETLEKFGMVDWSKSHRDPLINNTFGCLMKGKDFKKMNDRVIGGRSSNKKHFISIYVNSSQEYVINNWIKHIKNIADKIEKLDKNKLYDAHKKYWNEFWRKSYIIIKNSPEGELLAKNFSLQRFVSACAGRGEYPIKFNGSIFNIDSSVISFPPDVDYRQWGGPYWFQNTRLIYWPMLINGDYNLIKPFFNMYFNALPFAEAQTKVLYNHPGAFFPETMYFWGSYTMDNFGWKTSYRDFKYIKNQYIRYYFDGSLEVISLMLEYFNHTQSGCFAKDTLIPFAFKILQFYSENYKINSGNKIKIYPSQALETYWDAVNPCNIISGLRWTLSNLINLPSGYFNASNLNYFKDFLKTIPEIPVGKKNDLDVILAADSIYGEPMNHENPELYSVFPYRHFGVGKPGIELAKRTYEQSRIKEAAGWQNYDVISALLGYTDTAKYRLSGRVAQKYHTTRFPAFWGPNFDWLPDQDHGGNLMLALEFMLIQTDGERIFLFPSWPKEWSVNFKVRAPKNTSIEGVYRNGKLEKLEVSPKERKKDIEYKFEP